MHTIICTDRDAVLRILHVKKIYTDLHILAYPHRHTYLQCSATSYMHMDLYGRMSAWVIKPIKIARP